MEMLLEFTEYLFTGLVYFFVGLLVLILVAIIFGDSVQWKYGAEGYCEACEKEKIAIAIKSTKRKGAIAELKGVFRQPYRNREIGLLLNGSELVTFPASENHQASKSRGMQLSTGEPQAGDVVSVVIDGKQLFSQKLCRD